MKQESKEPTFEELLAEIEQIVQELESGSLSLEESLERYEKATQALQKCRSILDSAEKRIEILLKEEGETKTKPFELPPPPESGKKG